MRVMLDVLQSLPFTATDPRLDPNLAEPEDRAEVQAD